MFGENVEQGEPELGQLPSTSRRRKKHRVVDNVYERLGSPHINHDFHLGKNEFVPRPLKGPGVVAVAVDRRVHFS